MKVAKIPIDGLWQCLCPSIDSLALLRRATVTGNLAQYRADRVQRYSRTSCVKQWPFKHYSLHLPDKNAAPAFENPQVADARLSRPPQPSVPESPFQAGRQTYDTLSVDQLHDLLRALKTQEGAYKQLADLVKYLLEERGDQPALVHYDALIAANTDAENGGVDEVKTLLAEMKEFDIKADSGFYHSVLQVLAVHPDYLLRNEILEEMKERWYGLSPNGWHSLVVGLLRDNQYELAMDKLEQMRADDIEIQPWLYDIFFFRLCEVGELDEALKLLMTRHTSDPLGSTMWYYLLDAFSSGMNYEGTQFIWKSQVNTSAINPSDGICTAVLNCAARNGDPTLAASAIKVLSQRQTVLAAHHYEALLEAYVEAGDIKTAFRVLNIMYKAGIDPASSSTRPLYLHLITSPSQPLEGWKLLKTLHQDGYNIPTAAVNVVLEAAVSSNTPEIGSEQALQFYKEMHTICDSRPNIETFNHLLRRLGDVDGSKPRAMFLASEIRALGLRPTETTYDRLILVCMHPNIEDYEDCFRYLEEMKVMGKNSVDPSGNKGWWMRRGTAISLIRRCILAGDKRAWLLLDEMEERGIPYNRAIRRWLELNLPRDGENIENREKEADVLKEDLRIVWNLDDSKSSALGSEGPKAPSWGRRTSHG
ncbi:hypothetical protein ACMFMG_003278 [Clarireedia jacksonii]